MANCIIFNTVLILALSLSQAVPPKSINSSGDETPMQRLMEIYLKTKSKERYFKSFQAPPLMKVISQPDGRFLLGALSHPKSLAPLPSFPSQLNNVLPLSLRPYNQFAPYNPSDQVLTQAYSYLGTPYRRGCSLQSGHATDCSGFVQFIYKKSNIDLPRASVDQALVGKVAAHTMDFSKLMPGDLLFFNRRGRHIGHVGIYWGEGKMIHASSSRQGVTLADLRQPYYIGTFVVARRIFEEDSTLTGVALGGLSPQTP